MIKCWGMPWDCTAWRRGRGGGGEGSVNKSVKNDSVKYGALVI